MGEKYDNPDKVYVSVKAVFHLDGRIQKKPIEVRDHFGWFFILSIIAQFLQSPINYHKRALRLLDSYRNYKNYSR